MTVERGKQFRVVAIDDFPHAELVEQDVCAIFTVEPAETDDGHPPPFGQAPRHGKKQQLTR